RNQAVRLAGEKTTLADQKTALAERLEQEKEEIAWKAASLAIDRGRDLCMGGQVRLGLLWFVRGVELAPPKADGLRRAGRANLAFWRPEVNGLKAVFPHQDQVLAVGFSADGKRIVTGSADRTAWVWDAETGQPLGKPLLHSGADRTSPHSGHVVAV